MKIFVVDDERIIRVSLADELVDEGHEVYQFAHAGSALIRLKEITPDLVITDYKMPDINGIEFLKKIQEYDSEISVVMMTAFSTVSNAVQAMKLGAYDYIEKPFDHEQMLLIIQRISELRHVKKENKELKKKLHQNFDFSSFVGSSKSIDTIFDHLKLVVDKPTSVLLNGETGTGKELLTNIIHYNSNRSKGPLVKVSCAILSRELFESELFGHAKGSFTGATEEKQGRFEMANGGTLYLDDIDDVPLDMQVKLLRALEEREIERVGGTKAIKIDIRLIASTKKDLLQMVKEGTFREDLYYRISVFPINIPPLRERPEDIEMLINHFIEKFSQEGPIKINKEAIEILKKHPFHGNVRELRNLSERLTLLSDKNQISAKTIPLDIKHPQFSRELISFDNRPLNDTLEEVEKNTIAAALNKSGGNKAKAAEYLGLPATTLKSKIAKYRLETS